MKTKKYEWKRPWDAKGIEATTVVKSFEKVKSVYGSLTPENLVEYSKNPKTALYKLFEWDNEKAGDQWRFQQARLIINNIQITIISDGEPINIGAYEIIRSENTSEYKNIETFTQSDIEYVKESTLKSLKQISVKLKTYRQFEHIVFEIEKTIEKLTKTEVKELV